MTAIVPLLLFEWTVYYLGALSNLQVQVGLGLALAISLLGFYVFRALMGEMSGLITAIGKAVDHDVRALPGPPAYATAPSAPAVPGSPSASAAAETVPGLGTIREVYSLRRIMTVLWRAEAVRYKGRRVRVSVTTSPRPIEGTLTELTEDGLILRTESSEELVATYDRISAIKAEEPPAGR